MYNIGGEKGADNGEKYLFDTPVGHQAIQFWEDMIHKHRVAPRPQDTRTEDGKSRGYSTHKGNYVFWTGYPSASFRKNMVDNNFEAQIMWAPKWPANGLRAVSSFDQAHMVTKFAGSRGVLAETAELAHHLSGPEVAQIVVEHGNTSPIWRAVFDSDAALDSSRWNRHIIMGRVQLPLRQPGAGVLVSDVSGVGIRSSPRCGVARSLVWRQRRRPTAWPT